MPRKKDVMALRYEVTSLRPLIAQLRDLEKATQDKTLLITLARAATPVVRDAQAALKPTPWGYRTGALKKSMGFVIRRYPKAGRIIAYIGSRRGAYAVSGTKSKGYKTARMTKSRPLGSGEKRIQPSRYFHLIENGFAHSSGRMSLLPLHFLRKAFVKNMPAAEARIADDFRFALQRVWASMSRSTSRRLEKLKTAA